MCSNPRNRWVIFQCALTIRDNLPFGQYDFDRVGDRFDIETLIGFGMPEDMLIGFDNSYSDIGSLDIILDHIAQRFEFKWSLQNGLLLLVGNRPNSGVASIVLNSTSGLLLNPESIKIFESKFISTSETENDKKNVLALLQPTVQINDIIEVDSSALKGNFRVTKIRHSGDSRANEWHSNIEMD
jgi:hypothetical protein